LDSMLPQEVLSEVKSGHVSIAYTYKDMTLLFADIVGFTAYCASHSVEQAVTLVTHLFAEFDESTAKLGLYKVCTIGDAYVVVNQPRLHPVDKYGNCFRLFTMGTWMLQTIVRVREQVKHQGLDMRIGLHCGSFVAGIIGTKRLRFDIWGPDVLAGNLIEANGKPGCICVSENAKDVLERQRGGMLEFEEHGDVDLRQRGLVKCYICTARNGQSVTMDDIPKMGGTCSDSHVDSSTNTNSFLD